MEKLTDKQKANRAYYAQNAEKIKAQKRASYADNAESKPNRVQPVVKRTVDRPKVVQRKNQVTPEDIAKTEARRRLEDLKMAKELDIESLDYFIEDGDNPFDAGLKAEFDKCVERGA